MTTVSEVSICNLALQLLGEKRIASLDEDSRSARSCDACYELIRDRELAAHPWNFAKKRATLAPSATEPDFDFSYAFPLPADYLDLLPPGDRNDLDWRIENHEGSPAILTNDGDTLEVEYIAQITDPPKFHTLFVYALSCAIAEHLAEEITQSPTKAEYARSRYMEWIRKARQRNAFANIAAEAPEDPWISVRR